MMIQLYNKYKNGRMNWHTSITFNIKLSFDRLAGKVSHVKIDGKFPPNEVNIIKKILYRQSLSAY